MVACTYNTRFGEAETDPWVELLVPVKDHNLKNHGGQLKNYTCCCGSETEKISGNRDEEEDK